MTAHPFEGTWPILRLDNIDSLRWDPAGRDAIWIRSDRDPWPEAVARLGSRRYSVATDAGPHLGMWQVEWRTLDWAVECARMRLRFRIYGAGTPTPRGCWLQPHHQGRKARPYSKVQKPPRLPGLPRSPQAHRLSWLCYRGPLDPALTIDHLCRETQCSHPDHLEQITMAENTRRALLPGPHDGPGWLADITALYRQTS